MVYPSYVSPGPMQPALQCGYCDNSGNYITKFKKNIRTRGNKITPVQRGRKAEIRPYRRFFATGAALFGEPFGELPGLLVNLPGFLVRCTPCQGHFTNWE